MARTHGMTGTRTYSAWRNMISRCTNPNVFAYPYYGGRGIHVCERWTNFANFFEDMGDCPVGYSIERVDVNAGYLAGNCKWIPLGDQAKNKRTALRSVVNGEELTVLQVAERFGIKPATARYRIKHGTPLDKPVGLDKLLSKDGETMNRKQWAARLGIGHTALTNRFKKGMSVEEALRGRA